MPNQRNRKKGGIAKAVPTTDYLRDIVLDSNRDLPLHAQLRTALQRLIEDRFNDQGCFYSESQLISNLGVSQGTVRRALSDLAVRGLLEKRQARCTIVRKQSAACGLQNLAVFLPDYSSPTAARILSVLSAECLNRGIGMQPIYTHRGERLLKAYDNLKFAAHEGGVILLENSPRATSELVAALEDKGYDCVVIDALSKVVSYKSVGVCNTSMMEIGLKHLVDLGHRRITLLVNEPEEKESVQERIRAFRSWTSRCPESLVPGIVHSGAHLWDDAYAAAQSVMEEIMLGGVPPTAIFAISDVGAFGAVNWLQQKNFRVPEDVSVMGTDGLPMGSMMYPSLTTLDCPVEEMMLAALRILTGKEAVHKLAFQPTLLARESTSSPQRIELTARVA